MVQRRVLNPAKVIVVREGMMIISSRTKIRISLTILWKYLEKEIMKAIEHETGKLLINFRIKRNNIN